MLACKTYSCALGSNLAAGVVAGAASAAAVSCATHYSNSELLKESPVAAAVPVFGFYSGLLAALPILTLAPRIFPQLRSMLHVSIAITAIASAAFALNGVDMTPLNSTSLGIGLGAVMGIFMGCCFARTYFPQEWLPEAPFTWQEIKDYLRPICQTIILTIANLANGILAGLASGFLVSFLSQKIPETSPASLAIAPTGFAAALITALPFIAISKFLPDYSDELARVNALFTAMVAGILACGGTDMSLMRSAATGAGMGAAIAPTVSIGLSILQGMQDDEFEYYPLLDTDATWRQWVPLAILLTGAGALSGAVSGAVSAQIGSLTRDSFAIAAVAPTALTAGILASHLTIVLLLKTSCLDRRVIAAANIFSALTALFSSTMSMGGADMSVARSTTTGAGTGAIIGASLLTSFLLARKTQT